MFGPMEVLRGVLSLRAVAAANVPARETDAQMNPGLAQFQTFLAALAIRLFLPIRPQRYAGKLVS